MYSVLRNYINQYASSTLSDEEFEQIKKAFVPRHFRKRQYFLQEGEVCKYVGFITKGAMRQYSVDDKGVEHVVYLCMENWWIGDRESFYMLTPSRYNIDAVDDSDVLMVTNADFQELGEGIPAMVKTLQTVAQRNSIAMEKRLSASISLTAEERFLGFMATHPDMMQRFPQAMIASYLGISPETLSRIRSKVAKK